jgi:WD40 repeat protein
LRIQKPVLEFLGHLNRSQPCQCIFSPCGMYVVTGSEDKHAYIYDARMGTVLGKTSGHLDAVVSVGYNFSGKLATSSLDGTVDFFTS